LQIFFSAGCAVASGATAVVVAVGAGTMVEAATLFSAIVIGRDCADAAAGEITSAAGTIRRTKMVLFMVQNSPV
jgi:hypothetical protein